MLGGSRRALIAGLIAALAIVGFPSVAPAQNITVIVDGQPLYLNPGPIERNGRTFVPMRQIFERLGAGVVYNAGTINATKGSTTISLRIGSTQATVNGQPQTLDVAPFIIGSTTYVPLRFVAQSLGKTVGYDANTRVITINSGHSGGGGAPPPRPPYPPPPRPPYPPPPPPRPPVSIVQLRAHQPSPGSVVHDRFSTVSADFTLRVNADSVRVRLDGNDITYRAGVTATGFSYRPPSPLSIGSHTVRVTGRDFGGGTFDRSWSFTVSGGPPPQNPIELRNQRPVPGAKVSDRFTVISAEFNRNADSPSVRVKLDGNDITTRSGVSATGFSYKPPAPLDYGSHTVRVIGRGQGGTPFDRSWSFSVIRSGPPEMHLTINQPPANSAVGRSFVVQGNTTGGANIKITAGATPSYTGEFNGTTTAGPQGNFRISVELTTMPGQQAVSVKITATDPSTSQSTQQSLQLRLNQ